jgi:hypothetical protein
MEELLLSIYLIIMTLSVLTFVVGFFMAIFSKKNSKLASKLLIGSVITFVIGFGGCVAFISLS